MSDLRKAAERVVLKLPEALRLATILQTSGWQPTQQELLEVAAELRRLYQSEREGWRYADELEQERKRLHEVNQMLVESAEMALEWVEAQKQPRMIGSVQVIQALRQALEQHKQYDQTALELCEKCGWKTVIPDEGCLNCKRYTEPEPVGYVTNSGASAYILVGVDLDDDTPIYAEPLKREWVGLTDDDKREFAAAQYGWEDLLAAADAKLKEKNA